MTIHENRVAVSLGLAVFFSTLALMMAYTAQFGFGLKPCTLCLYQRVPYAAILLLGLVAYFSRNSNLLLKIILWLMVLLLLTDAGIAAYHVGVEKGIFIMQTACDDQSALPDSIEAMQTLLLATEAVPCDKPQFMLFGLSMAAWNMLYALGCAVLVGALSYKKH